jgi:hypothetical protein
MRLKSMLGWWRRSTAGADSVVDAPNAVRHGRETIMEALEDRLLFSFSPTGLEQEMLEMINRMRTNPADELDQIFLSTDPADPDYFTTRDADVNAALAFFGVDDTTLFSQWNSLTPAAPLAWNEALYNAARAHSDLMIFYDTQSHNLPGEPGLLDRIEDAGYNWSGNVSVGENVFAYTESVFHGHAAFAIDWGNTPTGIQIPPGHRENIMDAAFQEIGVAVVVDPDSTNSVGPLVVTQDYGFRANYGNARVLGVIFQDGDGDNFYDAGEGRGGVTITIRSGTTTYSTTSMDAGGYQVEVAPGTYDVTASGGGLPGNVFVGTIVVGARNVKLDLNTATIPAGGTIEGAVFGDVDQNGSWVSGEVGLAGWTVFVDADADGALDAGEISAVSNASGQYALFDLAPGDWTVRIIGQPGFRSTQPSSGSYTVSLSAGSVISNVNFGQFQWIVVNGSAATVYGTPADDLISWTASNPAVVVVNGQNGDLGAGMTSVALDAAAGWDRVTLTGSPGDDLVNFQAGSVRLTAAGYTVTGAGFEDIDVHNGALAGKDVAHLYDTPLADTFTAMVASATLSGGNVSVTVFGFDEVFSYSTAGGSDTAYLYDGMGQDSLMAGSTYALLRNRGGGFYNYAYRFESVYAYATAGGTDTGTLYDSAGDDLFMARPDQATMTDVVGTYFNYAAGFDSVYAFSTAGGRDEAHLYDGTTDDWFDGRPTFGLLRDPAGSFHNYAGGFDRVFAYATAGGTDRANLYDGATDDQFVGTANSALLRGKQDEFYLYASKFDQVYAFATAGGQDSANLYDSAADDRFVARPAYAYLEDVARSFNNYVSGFDRVLAFSTLGGSDEAHMYDSAANDSFTARPEYAVLTDPTASYYNYASGFDKVFAYARSGGQDMANLYDGLTDDRFVAGQTYGFLRSVTGEFYNYTTGFYRVYAHATAGGIDYATLYDSAQDDFFTAYSTHAYMQDLTGSYYNRANGFEGVFAYATGGGNDGAVLFDSAATDAAFGRDDYLRVSGPGFCNRAAGFDVVTAYSVNGGADTLDIASLEYILQTVGNWI